jgi:hypothetical protein
MAEGLILLDLLSGADGDVITIRSFWNIIMCNIMAQLHGPLWRWHKGRRQWCVLGSVVTGA